MPFCTWFYVIFSKESQFALDCLKHTFVFTKLSTALMSLLLISPFDLIFIECTYQAQLKVRIKLLLAIQSLVLNSSYRKSLLANIAEEIKTDPHSDSINRINLDATLTSLHL